MSQGSLVLCLDVPRSAAGEEFGSVGLRAAGFRKPVLLGYSDSSPIQVTLSPGSSLAVLRKVNIVKQAAEMRYFRGLLDVYIQPVQHNFSLKHLSFLSEISRMQNL